MLFLCLVLRLKAQEAIFDTLRIDTVTVTALRHEIKSIDLPATVQVLNKKDIQQLRSGLFLEESFRNSPGVYVFNRYNLAQGEKISIRGLGSRSQFGVRGIKVVLDNIPLTFPDGTTQLNNLDIAGIGKVEILKGPASVQHGNSSGGVIVLQSEPPSSEIQVGPRIIVGSYGLYKINTKIAGSIQKVSYFLNGSATEYEGFREFSSAKIYNISGYLKYYHSTNTTLSLFSNYVNVPYMYNPGGLTRKEYSLNRDSVRLIVKRNVAGKTLQQFQTGVSLERQTVIGELTSTVYGIHRNLFNPIVGNVIDVGRYALGTKNQLERKLRAGNIKVSTLTGLDFDYQNDDRKEYENMMVGQEVVENTALAALIKKANKGFLEVSQKEEIFALGLFSSAHVSVKEKINLTYGLRWDHYQFKVREELNDQSGKLKFSHLSPSIGLLYHFTSQTSGFVNYSTAFQTPTANELGNNPQGHGFNKSLNPEILKSIETGFRYRNNNFYGELSLFNYWIKNQLVPYPINDSTDEVFYKNAGKSTNLGADASLKYKPFDALTIAGSYSFSHFIFTDFEVNGENGNYQLKGNRVPGIPLHFAFCKLSYEYKGILSEISAIYSGEYYTNDFNGPTPAVTQKRSDYVNKAYVIVDARLGYEVNFKDASFLIFAGVNNVANIEYTSSIIPNAPGNRFFEPGPGRNFLVGVEGKIF